MVSAYLHLSWSLASNRGYLQQCALVCSKLSFHGHTIVLDKLLSRGLPNVMVRFLLSWYQFQRLRTKWNGFTRDAFSVSRGVRQGGVVSPLLFTVYIDDLLKELSQSSVGCYWGNILLELWHMLMT